MAEKEIPEKLLENTTFNQFQAECQRIFGLSDEEIKESLEGEVGSPDEVRGKYKKLKDLITPEDFDKQKQMHNILALKTEGNNLFKEAKHVESLKKYEEALAQLERVESSEAVKDMKKSLILNMALVHLKANQPDKAIATCKKILKDEPYEIRANFRLAAAYKDMNQLDEAAKYIKRIVIWPSTNGKVKELHKELVKLEPKEEEKKEKREILEALKTSSSIEEIFNNQGIALSKKELENIKKALKDRKTLESRVDEIFVNKKVTQFASHPVVSDLHYNPDIAPAIIEALNEPGSAMAKTLLKENPQMTLHDITNYIQCIIKASKKSIWSNKWIITFILAVVVFAVAFFIFGATQKSEITQNIGNVNETVDGNSSIPMEGHAYETENETVTEEVDEDETMEDAYAEE